MKLPYDRSFKMMTRTPYSAWLKCSLVDVNETHDAKRRNYNLKWHRKKYVYRVPLLENENWVCSHKQSTNGPYVVCLRHNDKSQRMLLNKIKRVRCTLCHKLCKKKNENKMHCRGLFDFVNIMREVYAFSAMCSSKRQALFIIYLLSYMFKEYLLASFHTFHIDAQTMKKKQYGKNTHIQPSHEIIQHSRST